MSVFQVDAQICRRDGICARVCPVHVISWSEGELPEERKGFGKRCLACGQCVAFCPHGACAVDKLAVHGHAEKLIRKDLPAPHSLDLLVKSRRSIRVYKEAPVPREELEALIQTACYAPTASNNRGVRWVVIYERAKLLELGDLLADWMESLESASPRLAAALKAESLAKHWRKGDDVFFRSAPHLVLAVSAVPRWGFLDAAIAGTTLELLAHGHGLGTCWAGYFMSGIENSPALRQASGLKDNDLLGGALMLGRPALKPSFIPQRAKAPVDWI